MTSARVAESLRPFVTHPLVRAAGTGDAVRAAEEAASVEATLHRARRLADLEPPHAFARTVELAAHEVRVVAARYWSRDVETWKRAALQELGGLLFRHVGDLEIVVSIGPDLRLARRDGFD